MRLRANRREWPGSGPPARPQESCPLWGGEEESSRNQRRNREGGRGSCQQTRLHHVTRQRHRNTRQRTRLHSGQGVGREKGAGGHPSCPLRGGLGGGQGECIEHIMCTRSRRGKSVHRPTGTWDGHAVCFVRLGKEERKCEPWPGLDHPWGTHGFDGSRFMEGGQHTLI
jgi:hypothetical protein